MRRLSLIFLAFIAGCASQPMPMSMPPPPQNCINIPGEGCKKFSAGNVGGTTLGNRDETILEESNR